MGKTIGQIRKQRYSGGSSRLSGSSVVVDKERESDRKQMRDEAWRNENKRVSYGIFHSKTVAEDRVKFSNKHFGYNAEVHKVKAHPDVAKGFRFRVKGKNIHRRTGWEVTYIPKHGGEVK